METKDPKAKNFSGSLSVDEYIVQFGAILSEAQVNTLKRLRTEGKLY